MSGKSKTDVLQSLKALQDKINHLEEERDVANHDIECLAQETKKFKEQLEQSASLVTSVPAQHSDVLLKEECLQLVSPNFDADEDSDSSTLNIVEARCQSINSKLEQLRQTSSQSYIGDKHFEDSNPFQSVDSIAEYETPNQRSTRDHSLHQLQKDCLRLNAQHTDLLRRLKEETCVERRGNLEWQLTKLTTRQCLRNDQIRWLTDKLEAEKLKLQLTTTLTPLNVVGIQSESGLHSSKGGLSVRFDNTTGPSSQPSAAQCSGRNAKSREAPKSGPVTRSYRSFSNKKNYDSCGSANPVIRRIVRFPGHHLRESDIEWV